MGPTATGKTEISIALAQHFGCEIISVDSAMVYRGMNIGTAKPDERQRGGVPHHLIDILDPSEPYSTGQFREQAISLMAQISKRKKTPLFTGGTMLYFDRLLNGLAPLPRADEAVRREIEHEAKLSSWEDLHIQLQQIDPVSASRIHPNDPQRIQRALEVYRITGKTITEIHKNSCRNPELPFQIIKVIIEPRDRSVLHARIKDRLLHMVQQGLIEEVRQLYNRDDLHKGLPAIRAVGYKQAWEYLNGSIGKERMVEKAIAASRQLAKRQLTWLRRERGGNRFFVEDQKLTYNIKTRLAELFDKYYNKRSANNI